MAPALHRSARRRLAPRPCVPSDERRATSGHANQQKSRPGGGVRPRDSPSQFCRILLVIRELMFCKPLAGDSISTYVKKHKILLHNDLQHITYTIYFICVGRGTLEVGFGRISLPNPFRRVVNLPASRCAEAVASPRLPRFARLLARSPKPCDLISPRRTAQGNRLLHFPLAMPRTLRYKPAHDPQTNKS